MIPSNTKPNQDKPAKVSWRFPPGELCVVRVWGVGGGSAAELSVTGRACIGNMPIPFPAVTQFLFLDSLLFFLRICFKPGESFLYTYWISSLRYTLPLFPARLQTTRTLLTSLKYSLFLPPVLFNPNQMNPYNSHSTSSPCSAPACGSGPPWAPPGAGMLDPITSLCLAGLWGIMHRSWNVQGPGGLAACKITEARLW